MDTNVTFIEHDDESVTTDKPHCGDCNAPVASETTDKPHCGDCNAF